MTRQDFSDMPTIQCRPFTDTADHGPRIPHPPVVRGPVDPAGLAELLGRPVLGLHGGFFCPGCAGRIGDFGDGRRCSCRTWDESRRWLRWRRGAA